jgi:DNA-binding CsgD family transcriptional regulator
MLAVGCAGVLYRSGEITVLGEVLPVVDRLYRAIAEPSQWPAALAAVADNLASDHVLLLVGTGPISDHGFLSARLDHDDFARRHAAYETRQPEINEFLPLRPVTREALIPDADFERDAYYNEVVRHVGGFHGLFARGRGAGSAYRLAACRARRRGNFDGDDVARLELLMPHLANAVALRTRLGLIEAQGRAFASLLDRLATALVLTDASARPLFVNEAGTRLLEDGGLELRPDGLVASTPAGTRRLREAVAAASIGSSAARRTIRLGRGDGRLPALATVLPIRRLDIALPGSGAPVAAVLINEPERPGVVDREAIIELFGLTPREADVAALLAEGLASPAIAGRLQLGRGTVASHLKRAFVKTDTHAQVELAALIGRFVRPTS